MKIFWMYNWYLLESEIPSLNQSISNWNFGSQESQKLSINIYSKQGIRTQKLTFVCFGIVAANQKWLLNTWNVAIVTKKLNLKNNGYSLRNYWSKPALIPPAAGARSSLTKPGKQSPGGGHVRQTITGIWGPSHFEGICGRKSMGNKTDELFLSSSEYVWCSLVMIYNNISPGPDFKKIF